MLSFGRSIRPPDVVGRDSPLHASGVQGSGSVRSQSAAMVSPGSAERRELFVQELLYFPDFDDPVIAEYRTILRNLNGIREIARFSQK